MIRLAIIALLAVAINIVHPSTASAATFIRPGDHFALTVYNHDDMSSIGIIKSDGTASLPIIGSIQLAGLSESGASTAVENRLRSYLRYPSARFSVTEQTASFFFAGAYNGVSAYQPGETLSAALGSLQVKNSDGTVVNNLASVDLRRVRVERNGELVAATYDYEEIGRNGGLGPAIEPGDIIRLYTKPVRVAVRGNTKTPGYVYLDSSETLNAALAQQADISGTTSISSIVLHRDGKDSLMTLAGPVMTSAARDGDVLTLLPAPRVSVLGAVVHPGEVVLQSTPTLLNALYLAGGPEKKADVKHIKVRHEGRITDHDLSKLTKGDLTGDTTLTDGDIVLLPAGSHLDLSGVTAVVGFLAALRFVVGR